MIDRNKISFSQLNPIDIQELLVNMRLISTEVGSHDKTHFLQNVWDWQYKQNPSQECYVYIAKYDEKIIAYYHVPVYKSSFYGVNFRIGVVQAVGVLKDFRKYGVFKLLSDFSNADLKNKIDFALTFPNNKSIKTFLKYNAYSFVDSIPTYVVPYNSIKIISKFIKFQPLVKLISCFLKNYTNLMKRDLTKRQTIFNSEEITEEVEVLFDNFGKYHNIKILRDENYLDWRYVRFPQRNYQLICIKELDVLKASVFTSIQTIYGSNCLVIMDFAYSDFSSFISLVTNVKEYLHENQSLEIDLIFISCLFISQEELIKHGLIKIPDMINPRSLNLLIKEFNLKDIKLFDKRNWLLTLGDWDVF